MTMINTANLPSPTMSLKDSHATAVQVAIRVRPLTQNDQSQSRLSHSSDSNVIKTIGNTVTIVPHQKSFHFDYVFDTGSAQDQVYTGVVSNLIDRFLDGYNVTILAYGQTSSGKTHTIMGSAGLDQEGIIPRAMSAFFERLHSTVSSQQSTFANRHPPCSPSPSSSSSSSYLRLPRSPVSPTKLRPISTLITNTSYGNNNGNNGNPNSSRRDSAPALLWRALDKSPRNSVYISFVEIYNEELVDLLNSSPSNERPPTAIREDTKGQIHWTGVKEVPVNKPEEVLRCLQIGTDARATGSTDMNTKSSRSHAIFTVTLKQEKWIPATLSTSKSSDTSQRRETEISPVSSLSSVVGMNNRSTTSLKIKTRMIGQMEQHQQLGRRKKEEGEEQGEWMVVHSKLHFVDLAGSERLKRTSAEGDRRKEGININAGLLALGNVISALASDAASSSSSSPYNKKATHIPYRDSKLTRMLQDSLGGNAVTLMIACISPAERNLAETSNTIKYAQRARNIKNKAGRNEAEDWMTNDNPGFLRSLITQLKSDVKTLKSALLPLHHEDSETDTNMELQQQQQKLGTCEKDAQMTTSQLHLNELEELKRDIGSLMQVEIKQDQVIHILEQKLLGMAQVVMNLQRQLDLQVVYIKQLNNDNQEKTQHIYSAQRDMQDMLHGMADLGMEREKLNFIVEWMDKRKGHHEDYTLETLLLQQPYKHRDTDDGIDLPVGGTLDYNKSKKEMEQNLDNSALVKVDHQQTSEAALEKRLMELDQTLEQATKDRDDLSHALEDKQSELQVAQRLIEKQTTELAHAQQQLDDTMTLMEQERKKLSATNDNTSLVAGLEDKLQVLQRARQLEQHEHDTQLDSVMDDLDKSQKAYEQQSDMVTALKQSLHKMQQRLDKMSAHHLTTTPPNQQQQQMDDDKPPMKALQLRPSSSTPYPKSSSASQTWSSSSYNISAALVDQPEKLEPLTGKKQHHIDINQSSTATAVATEVKEQLQQFADKKSQLMMKILDLETQIRMQRSQFSSEMNILESDDLLELSATGASRMERENKHHMPPHPPRKKLRSASSQLLISNNSLRNALSTTTSPPLISRTQPPCHDFIVRPTDEKVAASQQVHSKRASSSSSTTFLSTGTQTSSNSNSNSSSSTTTTTTTNTTTLQRTNSTRTAISTVSSSSNNNNDDVLQQTTVDQYNKMLHTLQCKAQVAESNTHAHQDVIHTLERQLSRSETSVRDTKRQHEVLHKEKQAYTLEIKNLRSQLTQMMTQQKVCLDESGERRKQLELALEQERRLKEKAEKAQLILEKRMDILMAKKSKFMCF